jgi:hypothetical protein
LFFSYVQLNIDPESLKPKLPNKKELKPYPITCYIEYKGHEGAVTSISIEASGQWMASGILMLIVNILVSIKQWRSVSSLNWIL